MNIKQGYFVAPFYYFFMVYLPIMVSILLLIGFLSPVEAASLAAGYAGLQVLWVLFFRELSIHREHTYLVENGERRLSITGIIDMLEKEWKRYNPNCKKCGRKLHKKFTFNTDADGVIDLVTDRRSIKCTWKRCELNGKNQFK